MNPQQLLALAEDLLSLYDEGGITPAQDTFTSEFISLIGSFRDEVSKAE